jgi:hypothetical protein
MFLEMEYNSIDAYIMEYGERERESVITGQILATLAFFFKS